MGSPSLLAARPLHITSCPSIIAKAAEAAKQAAEAAAAAAAEAAAQKAKEKPKPSGGLQLSSISLLNASGDNISNKSGKPSDSSAPQQAAGFVRKGGNTVHCEITCCPPLQVHSHKAAAVAERAAPGPAERGRREKPPRRAAPGGGGEWHHGASPREGGQVRVQDEVGKGTASLSLAVAITL